MASGVVIKHILKLCVGDIENRSNVLGTKFRNFIGSY